MSYDLCFHFGADPVSVDMLRDWFAGRANYQITGDCADYDNPDTGVHFQMDFTPPHAEEIAEAAADDPTYAKTLETQACILALNFNRPSFFGLEALAEANALADAFKFQILDPQAEGDLRPYDGEAFLKNWTRQNAQLTPRLLADHMPDETPPNYPRAKARAAWEWNYLRDSRNTELGNGYFVPLISAFQWKNRVTTATVWTDAIPVLLPKTEHVLLFREETGPRKGLLRKRQKWFEMLPMDEVFLLFNGLFVPHEDGWILLAPNRQEARKRLADRDQAKGWPIGTQSDGMPQHVHWSNILDAEWFA